jgi:hypothetical protein
MAIPSIWLQGENVEIQAWHGPFNISMASIYVCNPCSNTEVDKQDFNLETH